MKSRRFRTLNFVANTGESRENTRDRGRLFPAVLGTRDRKGTAAAGKTDRNVPVTLRTAPRIMEGAYDASITRASWLHPGGCLGVAGEDACEPSRPLSLNTAQ